MKNKLFYILLGLSLSFCLTSCSCSRDTNAIVSLSDINTIEYSVAEETIEHEVIETEVEEPEDVTVSDGDAITVSGNDAEPSVSDSDAVTVSTGDAEPIVEEPVVIPTEPVVEEPEFTVTAYEAIMYATKSVNLRKGPSTEYDKVGGLKLNDEVKVTGKVDGSTWYEIEVKGEKVYVSSKYLSNEKTVVAPTPEPSTTPSAPSAPATSTGYEDMVIDGYRIGDYERKIEDGWLYIKVPGIPAWIQILEVEPHIEEPEEEFDPHELMAGTIRMRHWEVGGVYTVYSKTEMGGTSYSKCTYHVTAVDDYYITDACNVTAEEFYAATGTY